MSESGRKSDGSRSGLSSPLRGQIVGNMDSEVLQRILSELRIRQEKSLEKRMAGIQSQLEEHRLKVCAALTKVLEGKVKSLGGRSSGKEEEEKEVGDRLVENDERVGEKEKEPRVGVGKERQVTKERVDFVDSVLEDEIAFKEDKSDMLTATAMDLEERENAVEE